MERVKSYRIWYCPSCKKRNDYNSNTVRKEGSDLIGECKCQQCKKTFEVIV